MIKPVWLRNIAGFLAINAGVAMIIFAIFLWQVSIGVSIVGILYGIAIFIIAGNGLANGM